MPKALKVSIVVRCLNELANLRNLFVLLKKQTFTNFEIIFVDSGMTMVHFSLLKN